MLDDGLVLILILVTALGAAVGLVQLARGWNRAVDRSRLRDLEERVTGLENRDIDDWIVNGGE